METLNAYVKVLHVWRHSTHMRRCCMCGDTQGIHEGVACVETLNAYVKERTVKDVKL